MEHLVTRAAPAGKGEVADHERGAFIEMAVVRGIRAGRLTSALSALSALSARAREGRVLNHFGRRFFGASDGHPRGLLELLADHKKGLRLSCGPIGKRRGRRPGPRGHLGEEFFGAPQRRQGREGLLSCWPVIKKGWSSPPGLIGSVGGVSPALETILVRSSSALLDGAKVGPLNYRICEQVPSARWERTPCSRSSRRATTSQPTTAVRRNVAP